MTQDVINANNGLFNEIARPLAKFNPTIKDPISPGLDVTAIKSISDILVFAFFSAFIQTDIIASV